MDIEDITNDIDATEDSFGVQIAKTLALSVVSTAGAFGGMMLIGIAYEKYSDRRTKRAAKKNTTIQEEK